MMFHCSLILIAISFICLVESFEKRSVKPIYTGCSLEEDYLPDPFDNTKYIRCSNGYSIEMKCAPRTIYNYKRKICVYRKLDLDKIFLNKHLKRHCL